MSISVFISFLSIIDILVRTMSTERFISTDKQSVLIPADSNMRISTQTLCGLCSSDADLSWNSHCQKSLCTGCYEKHEFTVIRQMKQLRDKLRRHEVHEISSSDANNASDVQSQTERNSITAEEIEAYCNMLDDHINQNKLVKAQELVRIEKKLNKQHSLLNLRTRLKRTVYMARAKSVTVSLSERKKFELPCHESIWMGPHPIVVSLKDHYLKNVFCPWRNNSVILVSSSSVDVYARGLGLVWSIPMKSILGNSNDRICAATWCPYIQRLILVGNSFFYFYDIDREKTRCSCESGELTCGCTSGLMTQASRRSIVVKFKCPPTNDSHSSSRRFLVTSPNGFLFYAYKYQTNTYCLQKYKLTALSRDACENRYEFQTKFLEEPMVLKAHVTVSMNIASLCLFNNQLIIAHRQFQSKSGRTSASRLAPDVTHYLTKFDFDLKPSSENIRLPSWIHWITAVLPCENGTKYYIADPYGQQLLFYEAEKKILLHRFHISPMNLCVLNDGRLVFWIEKIYLNSPIGKLHFITPPHIELPTLVANSCGTLNQSQMNVWSQSTIA